MMLRSRQVRHTLQLTQAECGLCCAHMILRYHGSRESMTSLRQSYEVGRDGLSLRGVIECLDGRGVSSTAYRVPMVELDQLPTPFVAHWNDQHFVVVESIDETGGVIVDPSSGRRRFSREEIAEAYSGIVVTAEPRDDFDPEANRSRSPWRAPLSMALQMRGYLFAAAGLSVLTYGGSLAVPLFTERLVDDAVQTDFEGTSFALLAVILGIALTYFLVFVLQTLTSTRLVTRLGTTMMTTTFSRLLHLPYHYFSSRSAGELVYRLNAQTMVRDLLATQLVRSAFQFGSILFVAGYMLTRSLRLSILALGLLAVLCLVLGLTRRRIEDVLQQEQSASAKATGTQMEAVVSIESLKLSGSEDDLYHRWQEQYAEAMDRVGSRLNIQGLVNGAVAVIQFAGPLLILSYGLYLYGQGSISLGAVIAFQTLSGTFYANASTLFSAFTQFLQVGALLDRIRDIDDATSDEWPERGVTKPVAGGIQVRDLTFTYGTNSAPVLDGIDMDVRPGQKVAIVGRSGSGKSTLAKLLCGLYQPTSGSIEVDAIPLRDFDRQFFYSQLGAVPQDVKLQNISIADNIAMGHPGASREEIQRAATVAQIHDEIDAMPLGYDTVLSELGGNLSGGQQQRIAIARTLIGEPRIIVYDEATSSLDLANEAMVSQHLSSLQCTRVIVAHRLSTVVDADQILVMSAGRVVERGVHAELIAAAGEYQMLFERQADLQRVAADDYL